MDAKEKGTDSRQKTIQPVIRILQRAVLAVGVFAGLMTGSAKALVLPSDDAIRELLAARIGAAAEDIGIVVAIVGPQGRRVISYGHRRQGDPRPIDGDTAFEIGSVTKVFTALLLADMVRRGEIALADPVAKHLPADVRIPARNGRSITLVDLATHTSGLPMMPDNAAAANDSAAQLYQFLARYELRRDAGAELEYSNLGYWLLGEALAARAGMDYESLLRTRILLPLQLKSTAVTLSPELKAKLAPGHDASLQLSPSFSDVPVYRLMPAAGGLVSTANDLSKFLAVAMGYESSPFALAMDAMLSTRHPTSRSEVEQALAWTVKGKADPLILHDGGTWGYSSAVAWDPKQRVGVVVLSNYVASVSDIARHLLRPEVPLEKPVIIKHTEIRLDSAVLDAYAGRYEAPGEGVFAIVREGAFLTLQAPADWGLPKLRLRPESRRDFFATELPLRVTFQTDSDGRVIGVLIYPPRGQKAVPAKRLGGESQ